VSQVAAFYDDSGGFEPDANEKFACFGMVIIPVESIRKCADAWWVMLDRHFQYSGSLQTSGIEAKSSDIHNMIWTLARNSELNDVQQNLFTHGLNTATKVIILIEDIWTFLSKPPIPTKYIAVVADKEESWLQFRPQLFNEWKTLKQSKVCQKADRIRLKKLGSELKAFLIRYTYEFLLQRLEYMKADSDSIFVDAFVISDSFSSARTVLDTQAGIQAGVIGKHSQLPSIVNRPWFGSSLHDPCLQMADWVAFAVRKWADGKGHSSRIEQLFPNFRGYPDNIDGRGIVQCPDKKCFPPIAKCKRNESNS
jgi:hypothetical protein